MSLTPIDQADHEWTARDGRRPGHFWADNEVLDHYARIVGVHAFAVYMALTRHANCEGTCFPSTDYLAEELGITRPTVRKAVYTLAEHGLIHIDERILPGKGRVSHLYTILRIDKTAGKILSSGPPSGGKNLSSDMPTAGKIITLPLERLSPTAGNVVSTNNTHVNKKAFKNDDVGTAAAADEKIITLGTGDDVERGTTANGDHPLTMKERIMALDFRPGQAQTILNTYTARGRPFDADELSRLKSYIELNPDNKGNPRAYVYSVFVQGNLVQLTGPAQPAPFDQRTHERLPQPGTVADWEKAAARQLREESDRRNAHAEDLVVPFRSREAIAAATIKAMPAARPIAYWREGG